MKAIIVSGGMPPSKEILEDELVESSLLICADGGANCLFDYEIIPDYLIGDFDSIDERKLKFLESTSCKIERYPREKDYTDSELALFKAADMGADEICFLGCTGTRIDHVFGNICLLHKAANMNINALIKDNNNVISFMNNSGKIFGKKGQIFSIQPYCDLVKNLSIIGAKYSLSNYDLHIGDVITISNEFLSNEVEITFESGSILIFCSKD